MLASKQILIGPFSQIITLKGLPLKGVLQDDQLHIIPNGGVVVDDGIILAVGDYTKLKVQFPDAAIEHIDYPAVLLPGFVDCHTHICFAGSRAQDYALKLQGKTYLDIARQGGGIRRTVGFTRAATEDELIKSLVERANRHFNEGVTTIEVKSGYGLSVGDELKMLRAIKKADQQCSPNLIPTCLAAHTIPMEYDGRSSEYLSIIMQDLLPVVKKENLANRVDIFIEETAFSLEEARDYLTYAKALGFRLTVHADQFTPGGAKLAAEMGALSADHLEASGKEDIALLANSETTAVVLPGASLGLGIPFAPARSLLDAGCCVAIASDWNPGSAPMGDLLLQASVLSVYEKLSFAETIAGLTFRAAYALGLSDRGMLEKGQLAHMICFPTNDYREILYHQGKMKPFAVWN
jgi:imidazolonepropionase